MHLYIYTAFIVKNLFISYSGGGEKDISFPWYTMTFENFSTSMVYQGEDKPQLIPRVACASGITITENGGASTENGKYEHGKMSRTVNVPSPPPPKKFKEALLKYDHRHLKRRLIFAQCQFLDFS